VPSPTTWSPSLAAILAGVILSSCYRPHFVDCQVKCASDQGCPSGLRCDHGVCASRLGTCWTPAQFDGSDGGDGGGDADADPDLGDSLDAGEETDPIDSGEDYSNAARDGWASPDLATGAVDGDDGRAPDLVARSCPPGQYRPLNNPVCSPARDLTGDGKADLISVNENEIDALISDGSKFVFAVWAIATFYGEDGTHFADVTGDGFADGVGFNRSFTAVLRSGGAGQPVYQQWYPTSFVSPNGNFVAQVDGDSGGKVDAILVGADNIQVATSRGNAFAPPVVWLSGDLSPYQGVYFADVDRDGLADAIGVASDFMSVARSTGSAFDTPVTWRQTLAPFVGSGGTFFVDVDGDGRADGVRIDDAATWVALSDGTRFGEDQVWYSGPLVPAGGPTPVVKTFMADVDGDGRADVVTVNRADVTVALSQGDRFAAPTVWYVGQFRAEKNLTTAPEAAGANRNQTSNPQLPGLARSVGSGWMIGTQTVFGSQDFGIYQWHPENRQWYQVSNAGAQVISVDLNGNPWVVNDVGQVYKWNGSSFDPFGPPFQAVWVASGARDDETWALKADNTIWHFNGTSWLQVLGSPPPLALKIVLFSSVDPVCMSHLPVVLGTDHTIRFYSCSTGSFSLVNGAGSDLTTDMVVDTNGDIERWDASASAWRWYAAGPFGTATQIGGWINGVFARSTSTSEIVKIQ
jgi:hypothetical protein